MHLSEGHNVATISGRLGITRLTCRGYVKNIMVKLNAHSQLEAVVTARRFGLIGLLTVRLRPRGWSMGDSRTVRGRAVRRFLLWSLIALTACAGGVSLAVKAAARDIAVRDASTHGISFARDVVAPLISAAVRRGDPGSDRILDAVVGSPLRDDSLVRIKVWGVGGQVIWSDVHELHGETFTLEPEEAALFGTTSSVATLSDLSKEENEHEQGYDELLEVYAGAVDSEGKPILVESYWNSDRIVRDEIVISTRILPLAIGALVLFILTVIPLALSLARRVDQAQAERSSLLRHALAASDVERRKISRELHDGLIQDLTSLGYSLPAVAAELPAQSTSARGVLESVGRRLQGDIASLRGLLTDLYPVGLAREGLEAAVEQLAQPVRAEGVDVTIDVDATPQGDLGRVHPVRLPRRAGRPAQRREARPRPDRVRRRHRRRQRRRGDGRRRRGGWPLPGAGEGPPRTAPAAGRRRRHRRRGQPERPARWRIASASPLPPEVRLVLGTLRAYAPGSRAAGRGAPPK